MSKTTNNNDLRAKFAAANAEHLAKLDPVELPNLGMTIYVKPMAVGLRNSLAVGDVEGQFRVVAACACNEHGIKLFDETNPDDVDFIKTCDADSIDRISNAVLEVSGLTKKAIEEAKKNS